jgi:5-methylcytosine-specific restriction endonuclease McrA
MPVKESVLRSVKKWRDANKEKVKASNSVARFSKSVFQEAGCDGVQKIAKHLKRLENRCHWCGLSFNGEPWAVDHVVPIAAGGSNRVENIVKSCIRCNSRKAALPPDVWVEKMKRSGMITPDVRATAQMLDLSDLTKLLKKSPRYIKEKLLQTGVLRSAKLGGDWRVRPCDLTDFQDKLMKGTIR